MKQLAKVFNRQTLSHTKTFVDWPLPDQLVGLEIEAENVRGIQSWPEESAIRLYWKRVSDGSLQRGNEYVLHSAMSGSMLAGAVTNFFSTGHLERDPAGSTHIHLNMMDETDTVEGLRNLCILMYLFEEVLFAVGDKGRAACGYTNRLITAPERLIRTIFSDQLLEKPQILAHVFDGGTSRYYGFNMQALSKHGTVEFRYFPTATDAEELFGWIKLLMTFKKAAMELNDMATIERVLESESSYTAFVNDYFGPWYELFLNTVPYAQARKNLDVVQATSQGIASKMDVNVNIDALKTGPLGKFFKRKAPEKEERPIVRPDHIHVTTRTGSKTPEQKDDFDAAAKHILIYDGQLYLWDPESRWLPLEGYGIYSRLSNAETALHSKIDDYVTYDDEFVKLLNAAIDAAVEDGTLKTTAIATAKRGVRDFEEWVPGIMKFMEEPIYRRRKRRDGMYRLQHKVLTALWSPEELPSVYEEVEPEEVSHEDDDYEDTYPEEAEDEEQSYETLPSSGTISGRVFQHGYYESSPPVAPQPAVTTDYFASLRSATEDFS